MESMLNLKILKCLIEDYTLGMHPHDVDFSTWEGLLLEYDLEESHLSFSDFLTLYLEVEKERDIDLKIKRELEGKISDSQRELKKEINFLIETLPPSFSISELRSTLSSIISYGCQARLRKELPTESCGSSQELDSN